VLSTLEKAAKAVCGAPKLRFSFCSPLEKRARFLRLEKEKPLPRFRASGENTIGC